MLMSFAKEKGYSAYIRDLNNYWSAVHRVDAARLFILALKKGRKGACYHGVHDCRIRFAEIAKWIAEKQKLPIRELSVNEANVHFSWLYSFVSMDCPGSNEITKNELGWTPDQQGLLGDIKDNY